MQLRTGSFLLGRPLFAAVLASLMLASVVLAGCGGDGDAVAFTPVEGTESAYCDNYRGWQAYKMDHGEGDDPRSPAAFRAWWNEYMIFNETALREAPPAIHDEWVMLVDGIRTLLTPVLEKYDFDAQRVGREGTPSEQAVAEPSREQRQAQDVILAYEDRVCGTRSPAAAHVNFRGDASSKSYCTALASLNAELGNIASSRFDPTRMEAFVTSDRFDEILDTLVTRAPSPITADVEAEAEWLRTRWSDVVAAFDYDLRGIMVSGTAEDRAVFTRSHPDVAEHVSRDTAYEEQVCAS